MQTRTIGMDALAVSQLGLGCLGMSESFYGTASDAESLATVDRALDLGVTLFDTADAYGPHVNEEFVGRALRGRREAAVIATKFGLLRDQQGEWIGVNGRPEYVRAACEGSLRRLGVDHIDLYYQHRVDPDVPIEETVGAMALLVKQGKVRHLGLCEASAETVRRAHGIHPITALQSEYSLFSRDIEPILPTLRELKIGLVPYAPLGRGLLGGDIRGRQDVSDTWRRGNPRFSDANLIRNLALVERVRRLAEARRVTSAQLALAWLLAQGDDVVPIPGTKRRPHLDANVAACKLQLTREDLAELDRAVPTDAVAGNRYADMSEVNV